MRSGIVHHKSDRKSCVLPTADRNSVVYTCIPIIYKSWESTEKSGAKMAPQLNFLEKLLRSTQIIATCREEDLRPTPNPLQRLPVSTQC